MSWAKYYGYWPNAAKLSLLVSKDHYVLKADKKGAKSSKPEKPHPPKLVCMHFTSTSTCMNFLS